MVGVLGLVCMYLGVQEQVRKRVGFTGGVQSADKPDVERPSRLHRRDTPHHLKNKRIVATFDKDKVASIIAQVSFKSLFNVLLFVFVFVLHILYIHAALCIEKKTENCAL